MKNYEPNPLLNDSIPQAIQDHLTDDFTNYIIIKDGHIIKKELSEAFDPVFIGTYDEALPEKINVFFDTEFCNDRMSEDDVYSLNIEHVNSGLLIHVPKNVVVSELFHIFYIQEGYDLYQNTRIVLEPNSEFKYFEYIYNENNAIVNYVSNSIVKENAQLSYSGVSYLNNEANAATRRNSYVFRYGRSNYVLAEINDGATDSRQNMFLEEQYASATTKTVAITSNEQEAFYKQIVEHRAPDTEGYIENYGVSNHTSKLTFEGVGKILKNMKRSVARQSNRGIVLGEDARLDANPLLLIDEYDVEAGHGAAIGKIDEEQLYYLMSRGLTLKVAERLIISGFLSPVLRILSSESLQHDFLSRVEQKTS
jgi:Fe-S cluster assembly protein SufD